MGKAFYWCEKSAASSLLLQPHRHHLAPQKRDLGLQRQALRAHVVAAQQRHAAKHAGVVADQLVEILIAPLIPRVQPEAGDLVEADGADELIEAIAIDRFGYLTTLGEQLADSTDPGPALMEFLTAVGRELQRLDLTIMQNLAASSEKAYRAHAHLHDVVQLLVQRAQAHGAIRDDITATDLMLLMSAPVEITRRLRDADPDLWQRYLAIIYDGLRPGTIRALPQPAPPDPIRPPTVEAPGTVND